MCAILPPEKMSYGNVGIPVPCLEVKLIDVAEAGYFASGSPPQGEICLRGPSVIKGYYKRPDLNEDPTIFTPDGWFRTGDVGQWNPNGTLSVIDRCVQHPLSSSTDCTKTEFLVVSRTWSNCRVGSTLPWNALSPSISPATSSRTCVSMDIPMPDNLWL